LAKVCSVVESQDVVESQENVSSAAHADSLYNWHMLFGKQSYDAIEEFIAKSESGIKITDPTA
jgi:hypothetical protein